MKKIVIIDYGMGNLKSVKRSFNKVGVDAKISSSVEEIVSSNSLVLPGVGAFGTGMKELKKRKLISPILNHITDKKPFLGICLGMQMLYDTSEEKGLHKGLGIIRGDIIKVPYKNKFSDKIKIPHIGWSSLQASSYNNWNESILKTTKQGEYFYFVHSYMAQNFNKYEVLAVTNYNKVEIISAVKKENTYGLQFHPENSSESGLEIIEQFCKIYN